MNLLLLVLCACATLSLALPIQFSLTGDTPTIRLAPSETVKSESVIITDEKKPAPRPTFRLYIERLRSGRPSAAKGPSPDENQPSKSKFESLEDSFHFRKYGSLLGNTGNYNSREQEEPLAPSSTPTQQYGVFLDKVNKFVELHGPRPQSTNLKLPADSEPDSSLGRLYGTFLGGMDNLMPSESHPKNALAKSRKKATCGTSTSRITYPKASDVVDILENHGPECVALAIFVLFPLAYLVLGLIEIALKHCVHEKYPERGRDRVRLLGPERQLRVWSNQQREMVLNEKQWWQTQRMRS